MKIRNGFVTNSSSSSFVLLKMQSPKLVKLLEPFEEQLADEMYMSVFFSEDTVKMHCDDGYFDVPMSTDDPAEDVIDALVGFVDCDYAYNGFRYKGDGKKLQDWENEEDFSDIDEFSEIAQAILNNKKELIEDLQHAEIQISDCGWEGDSDCRYDRDWYSKDFLDKLLAKIAMEKNCDISDIDDDMFSDFVGDYMSVGETTIVFDKETGTYETTTEKRLEMYDDF